MDKATMQRTFTALFNVVDSVSQAGGVEAAKQQLLDAIKVGVANSILPNTQYGVQPIVQQGPQNSVPGGAPPSNPPTSATQSNPPRQLKSGLSGAVKGWKISTSAPTQSTTNPSAPVPASVSTSMSPAVTRPVQGGPVAGGGPVAPQTPLSLKDAEDLLNTAMATGSPHMIMLALAQYSSAEASQKAAQLKAMGFSPKQVAVTLADWQQNEREQNLTMMSNISASQHRTAMGIIGNIRA